jgi:hypothetical protein
MHGNKQQRGFIALMSAIIISAILIVATVTGSLSGFYTRFNILDMEFKNRSSALADACVDTLLYQLATNGSVTAGVVSVGSSDHCEIKTATSPYKIQALFNNSYTNLIVGVDQDTLSVTSWQETAN